MATTRRPSLPLMALAIAAAVALLVPQLASARAAGASFDSSWGLRSARFTLPEGTITVYVPATLAPGDAYGMSIRLQATGAHPEARLGNLQALAGYTLRLGDDRAFAGDGLLEGRLPATRSAGLPLVVADAGGEALAQIEVPLLNRPLAGPAEIQVPSVGHAGDPLMIRGPFDGNLRTTEVAIGGHKVAPLAESPRDLTVFAPADGVGVLDVRVAEAGVVTEATLRSLRIRVDAPAGITAGETRSLHATVEGLAGLDQDLLLLAINRSPEVVELRGDHGGLLRHRVHAAQVRDDGIYGFDFEVSGRGAGDFEITVAAATLGDPIVSEHAENVTPAPHVPIVTSPDHVTNESWPPYHADNVTFPPHTKNVSWPAAHLKNLTWPKHVRNVTDWVPPTDAEPVPEEPLPRETGGLALSTPDN